MKILKRLIVIGFIFLSIFFIYRKVTSTHDTINYIALGDSISEGMNSYGKVDYGFPDYISDYLKEEGKLGFYTKSFSKSGYTTQDLVNDIEENKMIEENDDRVYITSALRDSNLVTLSIGANNFIRRLNFNNLPSKLEDLSSSKKEIDQIAIDLEKLIILIKKYAKEDIILIGYYNPLPMLTTYKKEIDELVQYANQKYKEVSEKQKITYIDIFDLFEQHPGFLPNPLDIHPNIKGYEAISKEIIKIIESKTEKK